jgi:hypothetical protein
MVGVFARGAYRLEPFSAEAVRQAHKILDNRRDLGISLAEASIVLLSNRHQTDLVLTLDERHFRALPGPLGRPFRLLPADMHLLQETVAGCCDKVVRKSPDVRASATVESGLGAADRLRLGTCGGVRDGPGSAHACLSRSPAGYSGLVGEVSLYGRSHAVVIGIGDDWPGRRAPPG